MGCVQSKKNVRIKNMLPKNHEISCTSGEIVPKKDEDFHVLCFDINFDGFLSTHVCLWPRNSPCKPPPTPDPDFDESGCDCQ